MGLPEQRLTRLGEAKRRALFVPWSAYRPDTPPRAWSPGAVRHLSRLRLQQVAPPRHRLARAFDGVERRFPWTRNAVSRAQ